ncbi:MAG: zinc metallopeptidase [Parasporobacterium sp.]|nr:zinc metallopeptidase [Parasporobacterium sp.]
MYSAYRTGTTFDWTYLIILAILFIASMIASSSVQKRYKKYSTVFARSGITGAEAARRIMEANGVTSVPIEQKSGKDLSDYYDPRSNSIHLSANTYNNPSVSAIGVACHEAGHAIQYAKGYAPVKLRMSIIPFSNTCSKLAIPLIFIGFILSGFAANLKFIALIGIILYAVAVFVQLVTLPVEFDASRRALANIRSCAILAEDEIEGAKSVLSAAAMTYVVAMLTSVVQLMRLLSIYNRRR